MRRICASDALRYGCADTRARLGDMRRAMRICKTEYARSIRMRVRQFVRECLRIVARTDLLRSYKRLIQFQQSYSSTVMSTSVMRRLHVALLFDMRRACSCASCRVRCRYGKICCMYGVGAAGLWDMRWCMSCRRSGRAISMRCGCRRRCDGARRAVVARAGVGVACASLMRARAGHARACWMRATANDARALCGMRFVAL